MRIAALFLAAVLAAAAHGGEIEVRPVRQAPAAGLLGDVTSHIDAGNRTYYDSCNVTTIHEHIHYVNSRIRNEHRVKNGYYLFGNRGFTLGQSPVSLSELARAVPQNERGGLYQLYLVQQQAYWEDDALYAVEELVCYLGGALGGAELGMRDRSRESFRNACEMRGYVQKLGEMTHAKGYQDQAEFARLIEGIDLALMDLRDFYAREGW